MRNVVVFAVAVLIGTFVLACNKKEGDGGAASAANKSYTVRGIVKGLPNKGLAQANIHHEAIPSFVGRSGEVDGMMSMSMSFGVGEGVSLADIAVGDKVEFSFEVAWSSKPPLTLTKISKLPADTEIEISGH